jgi:hypothetical protein
MYCAQRTIAYIKRVMRTTDDDNGWMYLDRRSPFLGLDWCAMSNQVNYRAPSAKAIDDCAQHICRELSQSLGQAFTPEMAWGLAEHMKIVAAIAVKRLNQEQSVSSAKDLSKPVDKSEQKS